VFYYPVIASPDQYCDYLLHATSSAATHTSLHWGSTWNMLTPLENLEPGEWKIIDGLVVVLSVAKVTCIMIR